VERGERQNEGDGEVTTPSVDQHTPARGLNLAFLKNEKDVPKFYLRLFSG
jgi:hypothetical protein